MVTIKDIAEKAEVSVMTVSNVLNGNTHKMKAETKDKVLRLIEELEYVPSAPARSLINNRSNMIAFWLPNSYETSLLEVPYISFVLSAVSQFLLNKKFNLILVSDPSVEDFVRTCKSWNIDGGIGLAISNKNVQYIEDKLRKPFVYLDTYSSFDTIFRVVSDDLLGGYIGTKYLHKKGHHNIAIATGKEINDLELLKNNEVLFHRFTGYKKALLEANITVKNDLFFGEEINYSGGIEAGKKIALSDQITAVFCTADEMAIGIIEGLKQNGKRVPEDVSVVGFDDLPMSKFVTPKLTTVRQQNRTKVEKAVSILLKLINGESISKKDNIFSVDIVERESVKHL